MSNIGNEVYQNIIEEDENEDEFDDDDEQPFAENQQLQNPSQ